MKTIRKFMAFMGTRNLIAIGALLALVIVVAVAFSIKNKDDQNDKKADNKVEESSGLQVEDSLDESEGDSVDFGELFEEEDNTDTDNDGVVNAEDDDDDNDGILDEEDDDDDNDGILDSEESDKGQEDNGGQEGDNGQGGDGDDDKGLQQGTKDDDGPPFGPLL